ncbi:hypothetical protein [Paenibacillus oleatilyticus]|uniref:hypothetical protein n=1 Tax=Paenibacillus oleatilyticus TaxID=2594886 RepID=UPI001C1F6E83|nr:hypothetical protein [Paenibacillus oleatilyticus]MBU7316078.1 hypothetical protein [Paenibacillus oleatilyticus]
MAKQVSMDFSGNELILVESRTMRDEYVFKDNVMDKVKIVPKLPSTMGVTVEMAANYYEVGYEAIKSILKRHRNEFNEYNELKSLKGKELKDFKGSVQGEPDLRNLETTSILTLITRRGLLRIGMLLTESEVAKSIRNYLLNVEEFAPDEIKRWAVEREISKLERRLLTDSIQEFYVALSDKDDQFKYAKFTNLVYKVLWDTDAKHLKEVYGIEKNELLRDAFSTEDLKKVVKVERAIAGMLNVDFNYNEIKERLMNNKERFQ